MKTIVIGTSTIGNAITTLFRGSGHDVIQVGRTSGDAQADLTDISSPRSLFAQQVPFTAVANAAGEVFRAPLEDADDQQWARSIDSKGMDRSTSSEQACHTSATADPSRWSPVSSEPRPSMR